MTYTKDPDYFDDTERDEIPEREPFQFIFSDGSVIHLNDFGTDLSFPHRKTTRTWIAEDVQVLIERSEWDAEQARNYILKNYER